MKRKELEAIGKLLLPDLPEIAVKGDTLFMRPIGHVLRGICFNGSIDPRSFYVEVFVQPLFVPAQEINLGIGWRLRSKIAGPTSWSADSPSLVTELRNTLQREALPFLRRVQSPMDFAVAVGAVHPVDGPMPPQSIDTSSNPARQQAVAYAWARAGDIRQAEDALNRLIQLADQNPFWNKEADQAGMLKSVLLTDPAAAQRQLDAWEAETVKNLGLEEFWSGRGAMAG